MKAMVLAAGEGRRMRPLTNATPKPLLEVGGQSLLGWHLQRLSKAGYDHVLVNAAYHADQIVAFCGTGQRWGIQLQVLCEPEPLETAGGLINALPLLGDDPFLVVNGDVFTDIPFDALRAAVLPAEGAHLVFVDNPAHHPDGDFSLESPVETLAQGAVVHQRHGASWTYSGVGVYQRSFFGHARPGKQPLRPFLDAAISRGRLRGSVWRGEWCDVGTPERLHALRAQWPIQ